MYAGMGFRRASELPLSWQRLIGYGYTIRRRAASVLVGLQIKSLVIRRAAASEATRDSVLRGTATGKEFVLEFAASSL